MVWTVPAVRILAPLLSNTLTDIRPTWSNAAVLDLACGTGYGLRLAKSLGFTTLTGVDISSQMLELAKMTSGKEVELYHADCSKPLSDVSGLSGKEGSFDLVLGLWLLNYAESKEAMKGMWANISTYLEPGGHFVGIMQNHDNPHPSSMQGKMALYGAQESNFEELKSGDGWKHHVEFDTTPKVEFDCFVLKGTVVEETAKEAGMGEVRYIRAGEEVKGCMDGVEGKEERTEEWWRESLVEYPNQVIVASKA